MIVEQMLNNAPKPLLHIADVSGSALFQGDCLDIMPLIPDKSVQLILADLELALNYVCYDADLIPKLQTVWQKLELLQEVVNKKCNIPRVSGSLHYDEKLLIDLWYKRNPCHELNSNSGEDMFWKTAFMVFEDYLRKVSRNYR